MIEALGIPGMITLIPHVATESGTHYIVAMLLHANYEAMNIMPRMNTLEAS